jgi:hypothetical protein
MLHVSRALLLAALVAMGCGSSPAGQGAAPRSAEPSAAPQSSPRAAEPALRPYRPAGGGQAEVATGRNPFRFAERGAGRGGDATRRALPPLPPPDGLPELPLPIARPPLRLLGLVTTSDGRKVAVINFGADLVLAGQGDQFGSRFAVTSIGEDAVELTDAVGQQPITLKLP